MTQPNVKDESKTVGITLVRHLLAFIASTFAFFVVWVAINWGYNVESLALTVQCACLWIWLLIFVAPSTMFFENRFEKNPKMKRFIRALIVFAFYALVSGTIFELVLLILTGQFPTQAVVPLVMLLVTIPSFVYWMIFSTLNNAIRKS
jgi:hypothetical protein